MADRSREPGSISATPIPGSPLESRHTNHDWQTRPARASRVDSTASVSYFSGARYPRRGSVASVTSSIGGVLDIAGQGERRSTARDLSHNAISALLQPPIVRTGLLPHTAIPPSATYRPPSIRDIPPVTLTNIPHVEPSAFDAYLSQVGPLFEARLQNEQEEQNPPWLRKERGGVRREEEGHGLDVNTPIRSRPGSRQSSISILSPSAESPSQLRRRSSGGIPTRSRPAVAPLSAIPAVYFDEDFHLENPRIFDVVSERSELIQAPLKPLELEEQKKWANGGMGDLPVIAQPRKALATNAILQEKLSYYLDTVEIHLISSISTASQSFFAALGSLKELHSEAAESVKKIQKLRKDLESLDQDLAVGGLEIVAMKRRKANLSKLADAVQQLKCVLDGASHCEELVEGGDLSTALNHINVLEEFACGNIAMNTRIAWLCPEKPPDLLDLRRLRCLDGFPEGMNQLRARVGKGFETRFLQTLLRDLRDHVGKVPNGDTLQRWTSASQRSRGLQVPGATKSPLHLQTSKEFRQDLSVILDGLSRSKYSAIAARTLWDEVMKEMKNLIRHNLPSSTDDDAESMVSVSTNRSRVNSRAEKSAVLARNLRALLAEDAEEMLTRVYCSISEALRRLQAQVKLLLDVSSGTVMASPPSSPPKSPLMASLDSSVHGVPMIIPRIEDHSEQDKLIEALDMSNLLGQAVDSAQTQITRVLRVRTEETTQLSLEHFLRYFTLNKLFADECEAVSGRSGSALRTVVDEQIKGFISAIAERERQDLADTMEKDRWDALDFTDDDSVALSQITQSMQSDPEVWLKYAQIWSAPPATNGNGSASHAAAKEGPAEQQVSEKQKVRPAILDEETYLLTKSAIHLLHGLSRFGILLACLPRLSTEISAAITDYIRLFTSRTNQLVLFAGATKSAGLERINTKHLALASRALGFVSGILPYIREFVRRKTGNAPPSSGQNLMAAFDSVRKATVNNQISIHEKLVSIMSSRARTHVNSMRKVDFDGEVKDMPPPALPNGDHASAAEKVDQQPKGQKTSAYMETLTKETITLHRVLSRHLPESTVGGIMREVFDSYKDILGEGLRDLELGSEGGRNRLLSDILLFETRLVPLDRADDLGKGGSGAGAEAAGFLLGLVRAKKILAPAAAAQPTDAPATQAPVSQKDDNAPAVEDTTKEGSSNA